MKLKDKITKNDLVVCDQNTLSYLLKTEYKNQLVDFKVIDYHKFIDGYFGKVNQQVLIELQKHYNYEYAKILLKNFLLSYYLQISEHQNDFNKLNHYLEINETYQNYLKSFAKIYFINADLTDDLISLCKIKIPNLVFLDLLEPKNQKIFLTPCQTVEEEVLNLTNQLLTDLSENEPFKIYLPNSAYLIPIMRIFSLYKIEYQTCEEKAIITLDPTKEVLAYLTNNYQRFQSLEELFEDVVEELALSSEYIDVLNKFISFSISDFKFIQPMIEDAFRKQKIHNDTSTSIILSNTLPTITNDENYYLLGMNQNVFPKIFLDDDFFTDEVKHKYGLLTSSEKNDLMLELAKSKLLSMNKINLSYNCSKNQVPSLLIEKLGQVKIKEINRTNLFEENYDKYLFATALDDYDLYGIEQPELKKLYKNRYIQEYSSYNNEFTGTFSMNEPIRLSYTSINDFYECQYKYYLNQIVKVQAKEITTKRIIGDVVHEVLRKLLNSEINQNEILKEIKTYVNNFEIDLTKQKKYYYERLEVFLKKAYEYIQIYNESSMFVDYKYECKITKTFNNDQLVGIIDKLGTINQDNKNYYIVIDYKTGETSQELAKIEYGLSLQIPIYLYLLKNSFNDIIIGGFLQKVLPKKPLEYEANKTISEIYFDAYRYDGITTDNLSQVALIDKAYQTKSFIKSVKTTKSGMHNSFYKKAFSQNEMNKILEITKNLIEVALLKIHQGDFKINPKLFDEDDSTCKYCKYSAICYKKYRDFEKYLLDKELKFIRGGNHDSN